jgi:predicted enzyme related to lactoylglutathione lyase
MLKISSILIGVKDLNKSKRFYEEVFEFKFEEFRPPYAMACFDGVEFNIEENAPSRSDTWARLNVGGRKSVTFLTDDLLKFLSNAEQHGAEILEPATAKPWGYIEAVIADPDGNQFLIEQQS